MVYLHGYAGNILSVIIYTLHGKIRRILMYKIFMVEDDEVIAATVKKHLEEWDYEVKEYEI